MTAVTWCHTSTGAASLSDMRHSDMLSQMASHKGSGGGGVEVFGEVAAPQSPRISNGGMQEMRADKIAQAAGRQSMVPTLRRRSWPPEAATERSYQ